MIQFLQTYWGAIAAVLIAVIDFIWAINPSLKANGILHAIWQALGGKDPAGPASS